ncbi:MAG TPA: rRNA adenine N-6-methyltransferase family protein [Acidobacteriaceae bacterium]|nr:rRNA adenine N-6-methyltransferase family protein [Acidobacteriaceae bacterium]
MATLEAHRMFYAELITSSVGMPKSRLTSAFMATPREHYLGPGPWKVFTARGYIQTPSDDPAFLYQDIVVALEDEQGINNGQPMLHALCLAALNVMEGETIVHIGAGAGYYTAILAQLTGPGGDVSAYEIQPVLAERAARCLANLPNVTVYQRSGAEASLPNCDAVYVSAGCTAPLQNWLDALRPGGRLLVPLTPDGVGNMPGLGGMLLITRVTEKQFDARFISPVVIIPCVGARDQETAKRLAEAFKRGDSGKVRSLKLGTSPDETCWCSGNGWWLSTSENTRRTALVS